MCPNNLVGFIGDCHWKKSSNMLFSISYLKVVKSKLKLPYIQQNIVVEYIVFNKKNTKKVEPATLFSWPDDHTDGWVLPHSGPLLQCSITRWKCSNVVKKSTCILYLHVNYIPVFVWPYLCKPQGCHSVHQLSLYPFNPAK